MYENALISLISLLGLWMLFFWLYSDYRNDTLKLQLFELRDRLFDMGADGRIPFAHPAYGMLRSSINGLLLHAERVGLLWAALMQIEYYRNPAVRDTVARSEARWHQALSDLPESSRAELGAIRTQINARMGVHLLWSSPVFWLFLLPVLLVSVAGLFGKAVVARMGGRMAKATGVDRLDFLSSEDDCELPGTAA